MSLASRRAARGEARRTEIVGQIAKSFGKIVGPTVLVLIASGIYNATWYLSSFGELFSDSRGRLLLYKMIATALLLVAILIHDVHFSRRISRLAREGDVEGLAKVRKKSRIVSFASVILMAAVVVFVILMQGPD